ncbi:ArnT family glycosyltransferase [Sedimentisphaera cyanobacteriorum]|nr:glycosyltransferase family 39 protein [Sedimentisphaera cyanobacteriorum]
MKNLKNIDKYMAISLRDIVFIIIILVPFILGKYCEFNIPGPFDSGSNVYSAKHILEGAQIGIEEDPSAQVGTLLMNMLGVQLFGFNDLGPKIVQGFFQLIGLGLMYYSIRRVFGVLPAFFSAFAAGFFISAPLIAKYGNVKEQFMTAFMLAGIALFVLYLKTDKRIFAVLAGGFLGWAPLFKITGFSAIGALAVFFLSSLIFRWKTFKQLLTHGALLLAGFLIFAGPVWIWINASGAQISTPYKSALVRVMPDFGSDSPVPEKQKSAGDVDKQAEAEKKEESAGSYVERTRKTRSYSEHAPVVFRYYGLLILPIGLAAVSIILAKIRFLRAWLSKKSSIELSLPDKLTVLLVCWWLLDMALVWVSTRPYEQYYIPLTASGAFAGAYVLYRIFEWCRGKGRKFTVGGFAASAAVFWIFCSPIFAGISQSPYSGKSYGEGVKRKGYIQRMEQASTHRQGRIAPWEIVGLFIKNNTSPDQRTYVWGWYPGIYVKAQRLSVCKKAFQSDMHTLPASTLEKMADNFIRQFEKHKPKYIVDSRKRHFPHDRPPLEFWPSTPKGFLPANERAVQSYEKAYSNVLAERIEPEEAERFEAFSQLREYIRENYQIVDKDGYKFTNTGPRSKRFGQMVVFRRK